MKNWLLEEAGTPADEIKALEAAVRKEIDLAIEQAKASLPPPVSELTRDIYTGPWVGPPPRMCNGLLFG